jgi:hypothetical protein
MCFGDCVAILEAVSVIQARCDGVVRLNDEPTGCSRRQLAQTMAEQLGSEPLALVTRMNGKKRKFEPVL